MKKIATLLALTGLVGWSASAAITVQAWYHLGETGSLIDGQPQDSSGNNYHFTGSQGTSYVTNESARGFLGRYGYTSSRSLEFGRGGVSGFWDSGCPTPSDNFGIEAWVMPMAGDADGWIFATGTGTGNLVLQVNGGKYAASLINGAWVNPGATALTTNEWTHLALVCSDGATRLYVNGVVQSGAPTGAKAGNAVHLGVTAGGGSGFRGLIDEARIFTFAPGEFTTNDLLLPSGPPPHNQHPALLTQPQAQTIAAGDQAALGILAVGTAPLSYLWYFGDKLLSASTNPALVLPSVAPGNEGNYRVVVTNLFGSATSLWTVLTVKNYLTLAPATAPNAAQQAMIDRKYGMFCHFGMNTFLDMEWSDGSFSPTNYAPTAVNADQWVHTAYLAGMRYLVCITKHHDGFCMWPSAYTTYSVKYSGNTNDVVRLVANACAKYGVKLALYYSLWDRHEPSYTTNFDPGYIAYMTNQLAELMGNYGPVCELWLDGDWVKPNAAWHLPEIYDLVKRLQPGCQIAANLTIGNPTNVDSSVNISDQQNGYPVRYFPSDFRLFDGQLPFFPDRKLFSKVTTPANTYYLPFEATLTLSAHGNWFYHKGDTNTKPIQMLENWWNRCTAQSNLLVFNAAPTRDGLLQPSNSNALIQLAYHLGLEPGRPFPLNLAEGKTVTASSVLNNDTANYGPALAVDANPDSRWSAAARATNGWLAIDFGRPTTFSRVIINEHLPCIQSYTLEFWDGAAWRTITNGTTLGESARLDFSPVTGSKLRLNILRATGPPSLWNFKVACH